MTDKHYNAMKRHFEIWLNNSLNELKLNKEQLIAERKSALKLIKQHFNELNKAFLKLNNSLINKDIGAYLQQYNTNDIIGEKNLFYEINGLAELLNMSMKLNFPELYYVEAVGFSAAETISFAERYFNEQT
jgi:hypothetical protein